MRYERKYKIQHLSLSALRQLIELHPASFRTLYPDRQVNSLYLDTSEYQTWNQNVMGQNERKKYRIRWYGALKAGKGPARFEIKQKHNELGWKEIMPLENFDLHKREPAFTEIFKKYPELSHLQPRLINSYTRSYFGSFDGKFRLTLDRDMRFFRPDAEKLTDVYARNDPGFILEIKYDQGDDHRISEITQHLPFRQTKHSKYVQGVQLVG